MQSHRAIFPHCILEKQRPQALWLTTWRCGLSSRVFPQEPLEPCWKGAYWLLLMNPWVSKLKSTNLWISVFHLRRLPYLHLWWSTPAYRRLQIKVIQSRQLFRQRADGTRSRWLFPGCKTGPVKLTPAMYNSYVYFIVAISFISQVFSSILTFSCQAGHLPYSIGCNSSYFISLTHNYTVLPDFCYFTPCKWRTLA